MQWVYTAVVLLLSIPPATFAADSKAYVMSAGGYLAAPGSITPFHPADGSLGAAFFAPAGGNLMAVAPGTGQIWEIATKPQDNSHCIAVLDPKSGATLGTILFDAFPISLNFDAAGQYAYVFTTGLIYPVGLLYKIDVATYRILKGTSFGPWGYPDPGGVAFSIDGSKLFLAFSGTLPNKVVVVDPQSLQTMDSIPLPSGIRVDSIFVSGSTLLVTTDDYLVGGGSELLYFDTASLQQTNSAPLGDILSIFGVDAGAGRIYLWSANMIEVLDLASGQMLVSQTFPEFDGLLYVFLSPDGTRIVAASNPILVVDPVTLAVTRTVEAVGIPSGAAYLDADTVLMLIPSVGAMTVIDQETATVTDSFPLGVAAVSGEVADPGRGRIFVGTTDSSQVAAPNVVTAKLNRITSNLPIFSEFTPTAIAGGQIYGVNDGPTNVYNLASGVLSELPPPITTPPYQYWTYVDAGASPPDGKTYWVPFHMVRANGPQVAQGVAVYGTATNSVLALVTPKGPVVFSPDSSAAYILGTNLIAVYTTRTVTHVGTFHYAKTFNSLAVSADGGVLYATDGGAIYVLDAATGAQKHVFSLPARASGITLSPDGTTLFLVASGSNTVDLVSTASGQVTEVQVPYAPTSVVVLPCM